MDLNKKLRENILFHDLSDEDFNSILKIMHHIEIPEGKYFIQEGDQAKNLYYIIEGKIAITKKDEQHVNEHIIACLESGDTVGEIALLDHKTRSASAKALVPTKLLCFSFHKLQTLAEESSALNKLLMHLTESLTGRIRQTNIAVVEAMEKQLYEFKMRDGLGKFLINVVITLCLFAYFLSWISTEQADTIASTVITLPLTLGFLVLFFTIIKGSELPLSVFGLTTKNWRKAVIESIGFTVILCAMSQLLKWILIHTTQKYTGHPLFEPYITINLTDDSSGLTKEKVWWMIFLIYWLIVTPLQELIARGGLQGPLEIFIPGKYRVFKAILISNLMFSTAHLFMGIPISLMVFVAGLYFGWLYSRHHTLIGVILAHGILGTWATMVVGF